MCIQKVYIIIIYYNNRLLKENSRRVKNIRTYYLSDNDFDIHKKFEDLAYKERVSLSVIVVEAIKEYVKKHGDGNPVFTLTQFVEDEGMKATPAFFRSRETWKQYVEKLPDKDVKEHLWQSQTINSFLEKKDKHGTTNVRFL